MDKIVHLLTGNVSWVKLCNINLIEFAFALGFCLFLLLWRGVVLLLTEGRLAAWQEHRPGYKFVI